MSKRPPSNTETQNLDPAEPLETPKTDIVDDFIFRATNYVYKKKKIFISITVVAALLLMSGQGIFTFIKYRDNLRSEELYKIETQINATSLTEKERFAKALPLLNDFITKYPQTKQYSLALFYRCDLYYKQTLYAEAEKDLSVLLSHLEQNSSLAAIASVYLANILWDQEKFEDAIQVLESLKNENMAEVILMELAEKYLSADQNQKAKQTLEVLLKDFPQTRYKAKINQLLAII